MISKGDLLKTLKDENGHFTLFAPTDAAFDKLDHSLRTRLLQGEGCVASKFSVICIFFKDTQQSNSNYVYTLIVSLSKMGHFHISLAHDKYLGSHIFEPKINNKLLATYIALFKTSQISKIDFILCEIFDLS